MKKPRAKSSKGYASPTSRKNQIRHLLKPVTPVEKDKGPSPDGLGQYLGRILSMTLIDGHGRPIMRPSQFATRKNTPGKSSSTEVERAEEYFKAGSPKKFKMVHVSTRKKHHNEPVPPFMNTYGLEAPGEYEYHG
jgi:hypothetical protein